MPRECLPEHLRDARHDDWVWPLSLIPRAWNAFCGMGPIWRKGEGYQSKPIPDPGFKSQHDWDLNGEHRPYSAITYKNGYHIRHGYRWDDGEKEEERYYNYVIFSAGYEYDKDGKPI